MGFVESFDEAGDVARVEGVAPTRAVDEFDGVCFEFDLERIGNGDDALASSRDDDVFGAELVERRGLASGVGIIEDEFGFVFVGQEDVGVGEDGFELTEVIARSGGCDIKDDDGSA